MIFDFDSFTRTVKLAYRRCGGSSYTLPEVLQVFRYYFETYELIFEQPHPFINVSQTAGIIEKMPCTRNGIPLAPEAYEAMIDQHFSTNYQHCDFNVNHFFSGDIRENRYYETLY